MIRRGCALLSVGLFSVPILACTPRPSPPANARSASLVTPAAGDTARGGQAPIVFRAMDLPFQFDQGKSGAAWPVEPVGGGVAIADFDGDGRPDLFFAQGVPLPVGSASDPPADVLLRNAGARRCDDVSSAAGLVSRGYGIGVSAADYDGDGFPDVYVTRYGKNTLWHNEGDGRFTDRTDEAGVGCELWSLGAAFADLDGDGNLDLFVANYFEFNPADAPFARDPVTGAAEYGAPAKFQGQPDVLYRSDGAGHFDRVSAASGLVEHARGMGVLATDFDDDGWVDILVANDAQKNALWRNHGDGTFDDVATDWGIACNAEGQVEANMGIAYGDVDRDGLPDVLISHFVHEHATLWRAGRGADGSLLFRDNTFPAGIGLASRSSTGWGVAFGDFDQDGLLDIMLVNGHIRPEPPGVLANPPLLWHNRGAGRFEECGPGAGGYFRSKHQGRGLAVADLDGDNKLDVVVVHHGEPSVVLWNETPHAGNSVLVDLVGAGANRDAIGSRLTAWVGERVIVATRDGGGGYLSTSDRRLHIGLGDAITIDRLEVRWPSGALEFRSDVPARGTIRWRQHEAAERHAR